MRTKKITVANIEKRNDDHMRTAGFTSTRLFIELAEYAKRLEMELLVATGKVKK